MPSPPLPLVQSLSPRIAVLTSDDVVDSCESNGCAGLDELLRPWESSAEMVQIMSSTLTPTKHPTFPLRFVSYSTVFPHPESSNPNPDIVVDLTSSLVGSKRPDEELHYPITRSLLLSSRPIAGHETFSHPVGMLLAISTSTPDPLGTLQRLQARVMGPMSQVIPWMDGINVLKFYVVVHDVSKKGENLEEAYDLLAGVKKTYGPHSTLLVINSQVAPRQSEGQTLVPHPSIPLPRPPVESISHTYATALSSLSLSPSSTLTPSSDPSPSKVYGARLSAEDTTRLVALVKELVTQTLVPWMEARIREWNEAWHSNRRGITGRLFGAGRKFFGSRPNSPAPNAQGYNSVKGYYPITSIEALSRRLADYAFMLRDYRFASTVYDSLRRDFAQDRAWRYAAAATEMYGLSLLLSHSYFHPSTPPTLPNAPFTTLQHTDISSWLEQAVLAYQGRAPANQIQLDALRVTVLYYEAWKMIGEWRGVAMALVRGAGEADEVPSAVMIEEAAAVDVRKGRQGKRRRAFHLVLAARRYETTGLKTFSRRCLDRASELYRTAPWTAAQDLVEYSLGRQAYTLGESDVAVEHFLRLLAPREGPSQTGVLEDLKLAYEQLEARSDQTTTAELPVAIFQPQSTRIVLPHASTSRSAELEAQLLALGRKIRTPTELEVSLGETVSVELVARNPLEVELVLSNLALSSDPPLDIPILDRVVLGPNETRTISFDITPTESGTFTISSVSYLFHGFFPVTQSLAKRGKRLHLTKAQRLAPTYAADRSLTITIGSSRPRLRVELEQVPSQLYQGEIVPGSLTVHNTGTIPIDGLELVTTDSGLLVRPNDTTHDDTTASIPSFTNRISPNTPIPLSQPAIPPGDKVVIPVSLTALTTGTLESSGMIIFGKESASFSARVDVSPLLDARAWVEPRRKGLLALEISNASDIAVNVDSIEIISPCWQGEVQRPQVALLPNQTTSCLCALSESAGADLEQSGLVTALGSLIQGVPPSELPDISPPPLKLGTADPSYVASRQRHRLSSLQAAFPTITASSFSRIFPLLDPLDLDIQIHWSTPHSSRRGIINLHGIRVAPEFSIVEPLRKQVAEAIARGDKATRTMYEETGRIRQQLIASVLDGVYAREDDPICVRIKVEGSKKGKVSLGNGSIKVVFQLENRSPAVSARWILQLPSTSTPELPGMDPARFTSALHHRGMLEPGQSKDLVGTIWVDRPGLVSLDGWELAVETGQKAGDAWEVRRNWIRRGEGQWIEVV